MFNQDLLSLLGIVVDCEDRTPRRSAVVLGMRLEECICSSDLLNLWVLRGCLLVWEAVRMDELGEGSLEEKVCVIPWR